VYPGGETVFFKNILRSKKKGKEGGGALGCIGASFAVHLFQVITVCGRTKMGAPQMGFLNAL